MYQAFQRLFDDCVPETSRQHAHIQALLFDLAHVSEGLLNQRELPQLEINIYEE